jgi:hypothetical protein
MMLMVGLNKTWWFVIFVITFHFSLFSTFIEFKKGKKLHL